MKGDEFFVSARVRCSLEYGLCCYTKKPNHYQHCYGCRYAVMVREFKAVKQTHDILSKGELVL